ncbi:MAG: glycosyltransferase family 39 protein [Herpetosiphonaceae bacterium]|nr:glycosyltransferase family 39 protein [Herpetosiphonaceae bacterium]
MRARLAWWRAEHWTLGMIMALALLLRLWALRWGLPYVDHPDEPAIVNPVLAMLRRGDWRPHFFNYPSLYPYVLRAVFTLHWHWGVATGLYTNLNQLPQTSDIYTTVPEFFVWGRVLTTLCGVATVGLVYRIGRRWWSVGTALVAAAVLAMLPFHIRHSQYITTDVPSALMTTLALAAALRLLVARESWRWYALAGLWVGLATGTKYNVGLVALAVAMAHVLAWGAQSLRQSGRLAWAALWCVGTFAATTPTIAIDWADFTRDMQRQLISYSGGHGEIVGRWPVGEYLDFLWFDGLRIGPASAALVGLAWVLRRRNRPGLVLLSFCLPYLLFTLSQPTHFVRNLLPLMPVFALWAGLATTYSITWLTTALRTPRAISATWLTLAVGVLVLGWPFFKAIEITRFEAQPNSKVLADSYVRDVLPRGLPVAVELNPVRWSGSPSVLALPDLTEHTIEWYRAQGIRYLISNAHYRRPDADLLYQGLRDHAQLIAQFTGDKDGTPGPHIDVLDLGLSRDGLVLNATPAQFGPALRLLGYQRGVGDLRASITPLDGGSDIKAGQNLLLNLYWEVQAPLDRDYALFIHVLDAAGNTVAQRDAVIRQGDYPTSRWQVGEIVVDIPDLPLPDLPAGDYQVKIGLYDMATFARIPAYNSPNATEDAGLMLLTLQVGVDNQ